jgi:hypothetical protein
MASPIFKPLSELCPNVDGDDGDDVLSARADEDVGNVEEVGVEVEEVDGVEVGFPTLAAASENTAKLVLQQRVFSAADSQQ